MKKSDLLRVAVLVDLPRTPQSGGHVKCWERLGAAAAQANLPLDLTVYFSGQAPDEKLGPHTRFRYLPPVLSTARLKFLPYIPDHTDLSFYHPRLARELENYDLIHTTDGFFAFARTAARVSQARGIPLVTSLHTDTPSYTRIFTRQTIKKLFGSTGIRGWFGRAMIEGMQLPERQGRSMEKKLRQHLEKCQYALASRREDMALAAGILGEENVTEMRRGIDKEIFGPHRRDRIGIEHDYQIAPGDTVILFVGRVDIGKNIYTLVGAVEKLLASDHKVHLIVAGVGPAAYDVKTKLGDRVSMPGFVAPKELGRLYASVDVLAVASEVETHSMIAAEAITSGCPVLMAEKSGVTEIFNAEPAMQAVESGVDAWIAALGDFARHPDKQLIMRHAAREHGRLHMIGWDKVLAEDFFTVWQKATGFSIPEEPQIEPLKAYGT